MVDLIRVTGANQVGVRVRLEDGSFFVAPATVAINATGAEVMGDSGGLGLAVDENGDVKVVQADTVDRGPLDLSQVGNTMEMPIGKGQGVLGVDITGLTGSGATIVAESTVGQLWLPMNQLRVGAGGTIPMSATEDSSFRSSVVAKTRVRIRVSVAGTGTALISYSLSTNASLVQLSAALPPGNNRLGLVSIDGTVPVTGTFWPTTQPVSGAVTVSNFPSSQAVTGTFWQAVQPVSGAISLRGNSNIATGQVAVTTTASRVVLARATRDRVTLAPATRVPYFVGPAGVTAATGIPVLDGGAITLETTAEVWAVSASNVQVGFVEVYG